MSKLEVGQKWRRRDGKCVTVTEFDNRPGVSYSYMTDDNEWYTEDGNYNVSFGISSDYDLVELMGGDDAPFIDALIIAVYSMPIDVDRSSLVREALALRKELLA